MRWFFAGVYGVIAPALVHRRMELAIRSARGARPAQVVALAMRTALEPAAVGIRQWRAARRAAAASPKRSIEIQ